MKIAIEGFPFNTRPSEGPDIFLNRLSDAISEMGLATQRNYRWPFYDIALFKIKNKSIFNKPFVLRVDGIYFDLYNSIGDSDELNKVIFTSIEQAAGVVFISDFSKQIIEKFFKKIKKPNIIIHNSVNLRRFNPVGGNYRQKIGIKEKDIVFITSAHWRRHKRLKETIKLFEMARKRFANNNFWLIVLGNDPDFIIRDKHIIYTKHVEPNLLPNWYRTGDIYLHLAWIEPCGNTQIEAMASGLPAVCVNNGGIGETVIAAKGGIVSKADRKYEFNKVDYYHPPEPKYEILLQDINSIISDYDKYREQIKIEVLSINKAAIKYVDFMKKVYDTGK